MTHRTEVAVVPMVAAVVLVTVAAAVQAMLVTAVAVEMLPATVPAVAQAAAAEARADLAFLHDFMTKYIRTLQPSTPLAQPTAAVVAMLPKAPPADLRAVRPDILAMGLLVGALPVTTAATALLATAARVAQ